MAHTHYSGYAPSLEERNTSKSHVRRPMRVLKLVLLVWPALGVSGQAALSGVRITSEAPYLRDGAVNLSCSIMYTQAAHTAWTINGRPPDDAALESIFTGRVSKNLWQRAHGLVLHRLDRLPTASGRYELRCQAVADGKLSSDSVFVGSLFSDTCRSREPCLTRGAVCRQGRCRCEGAQPVRLTSRHTTCRHAAMLGWPCSFDEQCLPRGAYCSSQGTCICRAPLQVVALSCVAPNASLCPPCVRSTPATAGTAALQLHTMPQHEAAGSTRVAGWFMLLPSMLRLLRLPS
ncbi:hypothetical protein HPB51_019385 [Rhipicephalus microplus]|uniref:Uncharacterized protein n=1 Tax=Rhipicephalus microplus TaxID=6941 RepID=A0A9J6DB75_RHIMP|nr:hypothetical protein HPB51_019385 [Rhipicephalus microplus]